MAASDVARKIGEGVTRPNAEQQLPIDVNYQRMVDWLVNRQKLPGDWNKRVTAIALKANDCYKELPLEVTNQLVSPDAPLDYFRAVQIRDRLAETSERTLFGGLTGQAAVWDKIVKAYEKGAVYIGEAALTMIQNVDYEIPYLRKQAARLGQQISDAERKQAEYVRGAALCAIAYKQECKKLGIDGTADLRKQLKGLSSELPKHLKSLLEAVGKDTIEEAVKYYQQFSEYAHGVSASEPLLPTLTEVREGRTAPPDPALLSTGSKASDFASAAPAISWDLGALDTSNKDNNDAAASAPIEISWGLDAADISEPSGAAAAAAGAGGGISWDVEVEPAADQGSGDAGGGISWDIDVSSANDAAASGVNWDIGMEETGTSSAPIDIKWDIDVGAEAESESEAALVAASSEEVTVLRLERDAEYRGLLTDDLMELKAFLTQRKADLGSTSSQMLATTMPESIQAVDAAAIGAMLAAVSAAIAVLHSDRVKQLFMIMGSQRFLERMAAELARKAGQEARLLGAVKEVEARRHEAKAQLVSIAPKVAELVQRTRGIKSDVETALSTLFSGRKVNILGDINTVLSSTL